MELVPEPELELALAWVPALVPVLA